jgi:repressor LexA
MICINGETGVVPIDNEATIKKFYKIKGRVTLIPENSTMQPVIHSSGNIFILEQVIGVIRKM